MGIRFIIDDSPPFLQSAFRCCLFSDCPLIHFMRVLKILFCLLGEGNGIKFGCYLPH